MPAVVVSLLTIASLLAVNSPRSKVEFTKDSLKVIAKNVAEGKAVLVDVRSEEEWNDGHLEGSIFVPVTSLRKGGDPKKLAKVLPKKKILYTFCVVGMRAKAENSSTMRPMSATCRMMVLVHWSKTSRSSVMTLP